MNYIDEAIQKNKKACKSLTEKVDICSLKILRAAGEAKQALSELGGRTK